jgi:hypothetical protein
MREIIWSVFLPFITSLLTRELSRIEICSSGQYFSSTSLSCEYCDTHLNGTNHKTPNQTAVDHYGNYLTCTCLPGYIRVDRDCSQVRNPIFLSLQFSIRIRQESVLILIVFPVHNQVIQTTLHVFRVIHRRMDRMLVNVPVLV